MEFRDLLRWLPQDKTSALFRAVEPDYMWADPAVTLLAEIATIVRDQRYYMVWPLFGEDVPAEYQPGRYGPPQKTPDEQEPDSEIIDSDARALAGAAQIRAEMGL